MEPPEGTTGRSEARGTVPGLFGPRWLQLPGRHLTVTSGGLGRRARSLKRDGRGHASRVLSFWNHLPQTTGALWFLLHAKPAPVLGSRCMPKPLMLLLRSCLPAAPAACRLSSAAKSACCQGVSVPLMSQKGRSVAGLPHAAGCAVPCSTRGGTFRSLVHGQCPARPTLHTATGVQELVIGDSGRAVLPRPGEASVKAKSSPARSYQPAGPGSPPSSHCLVRARAHAADPTRGLVRKARPRISTHYKRDSEIPPKNNSMAVPAGRRVIGLSWLSPQSLGIRCFLFSGRHSSVPLGHTLARSQVISQGDGPVPPAPGRAVA